LRARSTQGTRWQNRNAPLSAAECRSVSVCVSNEGPRRELAAT
jgi:hypothetical protein